MNIYTFELFWAKYHYVTKQYKLNKEQCFSEWQKCVIGEKKKQAIKDIKHGLKISALEYLRIKLNNYDT